MLSFFTRYLCALYNIFLSLQENKAYFFIFITNKYKIDLYFLKPLSFKQDSIVDTYCSVRNVPNRKFGIYLLIL